MTLIDFPQEVDNHCLAWSQFDILLICCWMIEVSSKIDFILCQEFVPSFKKICWIASTILSEVFDVYIYEYINLFFDLYATLLFSLHYYCLMLHQYPSAKWNLGGKWESGLIGFKSYFYANTIIGYQRWVHPHTIVVKLTWDQLQYLRIIAKSCYCQARHDWFKIARLLPNCIEASYITFTRL